MKRSRYLLCCLITALLCASVISVSADAKSGETIRFGMYTKDNYHIIDDHSRHSGYDHEYLLEIAKHTGWNYESAEGTWEDCITMLINGEIDVLGGVPMNEDWDICYAAVPSAYTTNCLLIDKDSDAYAYEDFQAFNGMRIGILSDSEIDHALQVYSEKNHFTYSLMQYKTEESLNKAMKNGIIDCMGLSDFRNLSMYKVIAEVGNTPLYYAASPNREDLITELDKALLEIHQKDKFFEAHLYDKYFNSARQIAFSKEEMAYLEAHNTIQVALFSEIPPVCDCNAASGVYDGFILQILDLLAEKTGVTFEYVEIPADATPWDFLYDNPNVLLAPLFQNDLIHYSERMRFLNTIVPSKMIAVTNTSTIAEVVDASKPFKLAIPQGMFGASQELLALFPTCELILCSSHEDGLKMVRQGQADMTIVNEILGSHMLQSPYYKELTTSYLNQITENITIGTGSSSDLMLMSILNKALQSFSPGDIQRLVMEYSATHPYRKDIGEHIYENWPIILILIFVLIIGGILLYFYRKRKKVLLDRSIQLKVAEENLKAEKIHQKELFQRANFDQLTGLYSPPYFYEEANRLQRENPDVVYTFFFINLSGFKLVNELYGTAQGNAVLKETASRLKAMSGPDQLLSRIYADQFILCRALEQRYIDQLPYYQTLFYFAHGKKSIRIQIKVGVYVNEKRIPDADQSTTYARVALQNHTVTTSNHIYMYQQDYMDRMLLSQALTSEMESALAEGQFKVFYQPQYDIQTGRLVSAEALVRWQHPIRGMISPGDFIPVFEANGFAIRLDAFVFETVCKQLTEWREKGMLIPVSVNLSRLDLQNPALLVKMKSIITRYNIPARYIHLEITESAYVENNGTFYQVIDALRRAGFMIEMDDFGSGYSSLNMLKEIPVDVLKLDMKFFSGESNMDRGGSIVEAVVEMAHDLGILVVAEGVETEREANFLLSIRCRIAQGYLYSRPLPVEEFEKLLATGALGDKMRELTSDGSRSENLYWETEQVNILLRHSGVILFDYDPAKDFARFAIGKENEVLKIMDMQNYMTDLRQNLQIHPDFDAAIHEAITTPEPNPVELDFMADRYNTGAFEWFHGTAYHYCANGKLNRVIGLIELKHSN